MGKGYITDEEMKVERLDRQLIHKGRLFEYYQDTVRIPNGNIDTYDYIKHKGAAAVVPVTDDGKILMVRQYRNALDRVTLEVPAGGLNSVDEPTLDAAGRELEEETGFVSDDIEYLATVRTTVAFCNEKIDIYVARNLKETIQHLDEDEFITPIPMEVGELVNMILAGEIEDSKTISAILAYKEKYINRAK